MSEPGYMLDFADIAPLRISTTQRHVDRLLVTAHQGPSAVAFAQCEGIVERPLFANTEWHCNK